MVDDVKARIAFEVIDATDIEQHRKARGLQPFERCAHVGRTDAHDARVSNVGPHGRWVESGGPGRGSL
jgi:hypothetical protein